jgi:hypothetical protein
MDSEPLSKHVELLTIEVGVHSATRNVSYVMCTVHVHHSTYTVPHNIHWQTILVAGSCCTNYRTAYK